MSGRGSAEERFGILGRMSDARGERRKAKTRYFYWLAIGLHWPAVGTGSGVRAVDVWKKRSSLAGRLLAP
jgi:hypothetical protein